MPKFKRAVSFLIAFLFILECFPARTFAASAPALTYSIDVGGAKETDGTNVFYANQRGDTVTVRFVMRRTDSQGNYSLNTMQNEIEYDMSFFEFVESSISVDKSGVDAEMQTRVMGQEIVKVSALNGSEFTSEQVMCSFRLKIKSDAQSDSGWVRCSEAKAVATDYASATVTERNLEVRLKQSGLTVTATGYDGAYDGAEHAVTATPNVTDGTTVEYSVDNGANWSATAPSRKNAGITQVKVRAKNDLYFDATADAVLNVTPKALTVAANAASKTFGNADPDLTYSVDGLIGSDSVSGALERAAGENAGTYAISQGTLSAGDNYAVNFQGANFTISPKDISAASISLSAHTLTYTGAEQSVSVNAVTLDGATLTETDYSVSGATQGTNTGSYTVTVTGQGNYTGSASVEWNIVTADMNAKAENVSVTYDKQPHGITVTDAPSGATITYSTDNETYSETNPAFTDAGARVVYYKITASGYDEFDGSATVTIAKRPVVVSGIAAQSKTYDGNANATLTYDDVTFDGIIDGDSLTVTASGAFDSADAGENKTVTITGLALGGDAASNYELASEGQQTSASANITPADMTVTATGYEGVYDRKPHSPAVDAPDGAEILWSDASNGTYAVETPSFKDAGTYTAYYRVQRPNYQTVSGSLTVTIARKSVEGATILLEQNEFIYDGEIKTAVVQMVTLPDGDILSETDYSVSDNQTANAGYYLLTVTGQGNYKDTAKVSWTIRNAGASGISAANISTTYDGKPRSISVVGAPDGATITYSTDGETYSETNPEYTDAGTSRTVYYKVTAPNYDEFNGSATITIAKRPVTVSGITAANKAYDGNTDATLIYSGVTFNGIVDGDELTVSATGTFADAEVGNGKTVNITNLALGGASVGNYQLAANGQQTETTANITANALNVTASGYSGVYDGAAHGITVNAPDGATVTYSESESGTYGAENPAYKNAGNYTVFYKVTLTGSDDVSDSETVIISKKDIVISGITAANKSYDGNTNATLIYDNVTFNGIISGDELTVAGRGTFESAETGNGKTVSITNLTLGGASVGNYRLAASGQQTETTANITANALNVTANGYSGVYDGAAHGITVNAPDGATVTYSETESGAYGAENPTYKNAGNYTVFYKVTLVGSDDVNGSQTVNISRKEIVVSGITAANKPYDGNTNATLIYDNVAFNGIISGDELTVSATGTFADAETGNGKTVSITNLTLSGKSVGNYQLAANGQQTETTANITANALNVTANGYSGVYDGAAHGITVNAPSGATVTYSESESGTYGAENPAYKNAGTYTVYYKVSMTGYADVTGSAVVSISKATLTLRLTMVDRSNPNQLRNAWPYADIPGVPSMSARHGVTEVSDYGLTVYSYKSLSGSEYLPYSAEVVESLPVGAYVLRVTVGENRNYLSAETETGFSIEKAVHNDVSAGPLNVIGGERGLSVSLESYLEEGYECAVSDFEGDLFSGEPIMDGGVLRFDTAVSNGTGVVRVTVSSANYEDYTITVTLKASTALTLRFDANGGSEVTAEKSLRPGEPYGTLPASTRPGYALQGWFTAMTDGEQADASSVMGYADTVLYARWTKLDYTVTALLNGGSLPDDAAGWTVSGDSATFVFHVDSETFMLPEAVMAGYTFAGWTAPGQGVGQAVLEVTVSQGTTENLTYAANWTEGGRIGVVEFEKPDEGSGILGVLDLTQESGESDAQKSDTDADEYPATSLAKALKEIACADETQVEETQTKDVTVSMSLRALSDLTDADETALDEASKQSKREQGQIKDAARETFGNDDTVKSDFLSIDLEKTVTVKDDGGGESRESDAMRVSPKVLEIPLRYNLTGRYNPVVFRFHDAAAALRRLAGRPRNYQPIENGFDGSFYVSGAGNDAVIYIYTSRFSSYSVTTSGVESWTVLFDTDGGTAIPYQSVATTGERKVARPSNPVKDGYTFAGWYVSDNGEEKPFDFDAPISGNVTIYAKWTENAPVTPVTPSYSGGGSGSGSRSYRIEVSDAEHGSVTVSAKTATNGQRVTVTVTPESGYLTESVTVKTAADKNVSVTKSRTNVFRFTMPANDVTVSAAFVKQDADSGDTGTNVAPDDRNATVAAPDNEDSETDSKEVSGPLSPQETGVADWLITDTHPAYISGFSDGTFRPENNITRAQAAMMFYRLLKNKAAPKNVTFKDMNGSEWYAEAVYTLAGFDIIQGYSDGSFHANESISRAAFTAIAIRLAKENVPDNAERFSDVPSGHWARDTIARASDYGWIGGYSDGTFHPAAPITRAAVTAIINRMLNRNADENYVAEHYSELNRFSDVTDSNAWYYYNVMEASNAHGFTVSEGKERWNG